MKGLNLEALQDLGQIEIKEDYTREESFTDPMMGMLKTGKTKEEQKDTDTTLNMPQLIERVSDKDRYVDRLKTETETQNKEKLKARQTENDTSWLFAPLTAQMFEANQQDSFDMAFEGKSLSKSQKSKRAAKVGKKSQNINAIQAAVKTYHTVRDIAAADIAQKVLDDNEEYAPNPKYEDLIKDVSAYAASSQDDVAMAAAAAIIEKTSKEETKDDVYDVFSIIKDADFSEFEYDSDQEFLRNLSHKMAKLKAFSRVEEVYQALEKEKRLSRVLGDDAYKIREKLFVFKYINEDYNNRMKMMNNTFYAILGQKDLGSYSVERLNKINGVDAHRTLGDYRDGLVGLKLNRYFGKGVKISDYQNNMTDLLQKESMTDSESIYGSVTEMVESYAKKAGYDMTPGLQRASAMAMVYYDRQSWFSKAENEISELLRDHFVENEIMENKQYTKDKKAQVLSFIEDLKTAKGYLHELNEMQAQMGILHEKHNADMGEVALNDRLAGTYTEYLQTLPFVIQTASKSKAAGDMIDKFLRDFGFSSHGVEDTGIERYRNAIKFKNGDVEKKSYEDKDMRESADEDVDRLLQGLTIELYYMHKDHPQDGREQYSGIHYDGYYDLPPVEQWHVYTIAGRIIMSEKKYAAADRSGQYWNALYDSYATKGNPYDPNGPYYNTYKKMKKE